MSWRLGEIPTLFHFPGPQERINTECFKIWLAYTLDTLSKLSFRPRRETPRLLAGQSFKTVVIHSTMRSLFFFPRPLHLRPRIPQRDRPIKNQRTGRRIRAVN